MKDSYTYLPPKTTFAAVLLGIYPFANHTEKQVEAMKMADMQYDELPLTELISRALRLMLPQE